MKPVPLQSNLPKPTTAFGNPAPIAQYYICPHCNKQSPLVREWVGLTPREVELLDGMIEVQLHHAAQCDRIGNRVMADKQKGWDMERVELLRRLKEKNI